MSSDKQSGITARGSGVLLPVFSLPGKYSCGSFGKEAFDFIDFLADCGFSYWQVLPFCMTDEYNSPYKSFSAFAGNPYFIDLRRLADEGLLTEKELSEAEQNTPYVCEYERLGKERLDLLRLAASRSGDDLKKAITDFTEADRHLADACRFLALKEANHNLPWYEWTVSEYSEEELFFRRFVQYFFFGQWEKVRKHAASRGVKIIGDIPIYVSYDSADVCFGRELFLTDREGRPSAVAGVPPDYFSADGQLWGNPIYDWKKMKKDGYGWWRARLAHELSLFDGVRIDHFRGLESYWSVPAGAETAKEGHWEKGPGKSFIRMLSEISDGKLIIAEDLGVITDEVAALREYGNFPGMRVLQFAFLGDPDSPHLPHNYVKNCVAYTGTHDNNTLLGWLWELDPGTRSRMLEYMGYSGNWEASISTIIRRMLASSAGAVIFPLQDLLGYGSDTRLNRPGNAAGNWSYRVTYDQLSTIDRRHYAYLNKLYERS